MKPHLEGLTGVKAVPTCQDMSPGPSCARFPEITSLISGLAHPSTVAQALLNRWQDGSPRTTPARAPQAVRTKHTPPPK